MTAQLFGPAIELPRTKHYAAESPISGWRSQQNHLSHRSLFVFSSIFHDFSMIVDGVISSLPRKHDAGDIQLCDILNLC